MIQYVRGNAKYKNIGILANTQYGNPEQEDKLLELGANDFIYKPTTPKVIKSCVIKAMSNTAKMGTVVL